MPLNPGLSMQVLRPDQIDAGIMDNKLKQAKVDNIPLDSQIKQQEVQKGDATVKLEQLKAADAKLNHRLKLLGNAVDQPSWDRALQESAADGEDISDEPRQFDPSYVRQLGMQGLQMKDKLKFELDKALNDARVGTEKAQAGSFDALSNKRNAEANAVPSPSAAPNVNEGGLLPPPVVGGVPSPNAAPAARVTGDDFMKQLESSQPDMAAQVKAVGEGRAPYPAFKSQDALRQLVNRAYPGMTAQDFGTRVATRKAFTSGQQAQNITALNTVAGHLDKLDQDSKNIGDTGVHLLNELKNYGAAKIGSPALKEYNQTADAVASELAKVFKGTGATSEGQIQEWRSHVDAANTLAEKKAVLRGGLDLIKSRLQAMTDSYNKGMGSAKDPFDLLSPKAKEVFQKLENETADKKLSPQGSNPIDDELRKRGVIK